MSSSERWGRVLAALILGAASFTLAGCTNSADSDTPAATDPATDAAVVTIAVGDCFNDADVEGQSTTVPTVDCAAPHDSEAFESIIMTDDDFPGADDVTSQAEAGCTAAFATFVGLDYGTSTLKYSYYYPTAASWAQGDRDILCLVYDPAAQTTGTLKSAAR